MVPTNLSGTRPLSSSDKTLDKKAQLMYQEKFLLCVRLSKQDGGVYLRGRCSAEMKKSVVYQVDLLLSEAGVISETQCECGAGMGPSAHCKHVTCVLLALVDFTDTKSICVQETCTERLQTFHKVKKFKGSPQKAQQVRLKEIPSNTSNSIFNKTDFDPRPLKFRNQPSYPAYLRNTCVNFQSPTSMPILQTVPPANMKALCMDHDYMKESPEEKFLHEKNILTIDPVTARDIEMRTRGQGANKRWMEEH